MNIKTISLNLLVSVVLLTGYHFLFNNNKTHSFAYIDTAKLMSGYKRMSDVKKIIGSKTKLLQANIDTLAQELQNDIKKYEKDRSEMSEREKKTTEELIGHKQQQFMQYKQATQNKAGEEEQKLTNEVLTKVNEIISDYGKKNNYTIIFGTSSGNIVYANEAINITNQMLEELNKKYNQEYK